MDALIEFLKYLDDSNIAYLLMIAFFLVIGGFNNVAQKENKRLRKLLRNTVKENGRWPN